MTLCDNSNKFTTLVTLLLSITKLTTQLILLTLHQLDFQYYVPKSKLPDLTITEIYGTCSKLITHETR